MYKPILLSFLIVTLTIILISAGFGFDNPNLPKLELDVELDISIEYVFVPQFIFAHNNVNISVLGADTWTNITFDEEDVDVKQGISHTFNDNTNHTFMIMVEGIYDISYNFDVEDGSPTSSNIDVAGRMVFLNGTEVLGSVFETDLTKFGVEIELSHPFLARLYSGDRVYFQFIAEDSDVELSTHGSYGDHPESASIVIKKIANLP